VFYDKRITLYIPIHTVIIVHNIYLGAQEPAILPSGNALRILKYRSLEARKRHKDTLTALSMMRDEDDFKNIIRNISVYPFL